MSSHTHTRPLEIEQAKSVACLISWFFNTFSFTTAQSEGKEVSWVSNTETRVLLR